MSDGAIVFIGVLVFVFVGLGFLFLVVAASVSEIEEASGITAIRARKKAERKAKAEQSKIDWAPGGAKHEAMQARLRRWGMKV